MVYFSLERLLCQAMKFKKDNKYGLGRTRNYTTVVYPDSAPENWQNLLDDLHISAFVSPLHDKDVNLGGEIKKPHWHVVIMFDSVKTVKQARNVFDVIGGIGCEAIESLRGVVRYLCHLDNPEKVRYRSEDVKCFGGANYISACSLVRDKNRIIREMMDFCEENKIVSFYCLLKYCKSENQEWFDSLCDNSTFVVKEYLKSKFWTQERNDTMNV